MLCTRAVGASTQSTMEVGCIFLNALKARVPEYVPRAYLGDAAEAFANAAKEVFPSIETRLMCSIHVYKVSVHIIFTYGTSGKQFTFFRYCFTFCRAWRK
jgi:hypothetical protein